MDKADRLDKVKHTGVMNITHNEIPQGYLTQGKKLLSDLIEKKISLEEFLKEVSLMAMQQDCGFDEIRFHNYPTRPKELLEYDELSGEAKRNINPNFWKIPVVSEYILQYKKILGRNMADLYWLRILKRRFTHWGDQKMVAKIDERLEAFRRVRRLHEERTGKEIEDIG